MSRDSGSFGGAAAIPKRALLDLVAAELTYRSSDDALAALYSAAGITPGALTFVQFNRPKRARCCAFRGIRGVATPRSTCSVTPCLPPSHLQTPTSCTPFVRGDA